MVDTPILESVPDDQVKGIDVLRAVRSFDPCMPKLPSTNVFAYITEVAVVGLAVFLTLPVGRRLIRVHVWPVLRRGATGLIATARQPSKLVMLLGGSLVVTLSYILALGVSVEAFGGGVSFTKIALAYLTGSAVASAAPTPGAWARPKPPMPPPSVGLGWNRPRRSRPCSCSAPAPSGCRSCPGGSPSGRSASTASCEPTWLLNWARCASRRKRIW